MAAQESAVSDAFSARGFANPQIVLRWREFAGPVLGRLTAPLSLSPQGQLTLSADPSVAILLQHQTQPLIQRLNMALGGAQIVKVKVVSGKFARQTSPKPSAPLSPAQRQWAAQVAAGIQDPELKAALSRLAQAVAAETAIAPLRTKS